MLYFDHNSTTPPAREVAEALDWANQNVFGNASSVHQAGQTARRLLEQSRKTVASALGCMPSELVFTASGTESDNLALFGLMRSAAARGGHLVSTTIEHPAVLESCRQLAREGCAITLVDPDGDGFVSPDRIRVALRDNTFLVSLMHANNETGAIQPLADIAALVADRRRSGQTIFLHSDGVQSFGKIPVNVTALSVDLYSVSGHKIQGPKGIGALYVRKGLSLAPVSYGGRHERDRRAGTENVPAAIGFARAVELLAEKGQHADDAGKLRDYFERSLLQLARARQQEISINSAPLERLPNTSNVEFAGMSGEAITIALDLRGMAVSTGSACSSGSIEPSHVLLAMGRSKEQARASVRFSFGPANSVSDVDHLLEALDGILTAAQDRNKVLWHANV